jgi:hypothetical protein
VGTQITRNREPQSADLSSTTLIVEYEKAERTSFLKREAKNFLKKQK